MAAATERAVDRHIAGHGMKAASTSPTMMGRCVPAGVLPDARTFCTSGA
jgi:hypothetical protein